MLLFYQQVAPIVAAAGFQPYDGDPWSDGTYFTDSTGWVEE